MFTQLDALLSTEFIYVKIITVGHLFRELLSSNSKFSRKKAKALEMAPRRKFAAKS